MRDPFETSGHFTENVQRGCERVPASTVGPQGNLQPPVADWSARLQIAGSGKG